MNRTCLDCGTEVKGRADKKFCDDQCRSNFNNRIKSESEGYVKLINQILKKNRSILEKLSPEGKNKVHKSKLTQMGFDFGYFTNTYETQKSQTYKFCYEFGYLALENDFYLLVKRQE
jgi:hypothetical protein